MLRACRSGEPVDSYYSEGFRLLGILILIRLFHSPKWKKTRSNFFAYQNVAYTNDRMRKTRIEPQAVNRERSERQTFSTDKDYI
jgi:hypothetical protein